MNDCRSEGGVCGSGVRMEMWDRVLRVAWTLPDAASLVLLSCDSPQAMLRTADVDGDGVVDWADYHKTIRKTSAL